MSNPLALPFNEYRNYEYNPFEYGINYPNFCPSSPINQKLITHKWKPS